MSPAKFPSFAGPPQHSGSGGGGGSSTPPPLPGKGPVSPWIRVAKVLLILAVAYGAYYWEIVRVVVPQNRVLVLIKKNGGHTLGGDQIIIPRAPSADEPNYDARRKAWESKYADCNGIMEQVYPEGTYFFSPWDYDREIVNISGRGAESSWERAGLAIVPNDKVGVVIKKFGGDKLDVDKETGQVIQIMADPGRDQRGPLPTVLRPGRYNEYANPYAYEIKLVDPVVVNPGHRGVVTVMAGKPATQPNEYLVRAGEQGMQPLPEPEGFRYVNPYQKRIMPISIQSQRFEMIDDPRSGVQDAIRFPSADSFEIKLDGFVEWSIDERKLPLIYTQYGTGGELIKELEEKVILPYARAFCRLAGSQYNARDFISGDTKLKFQQDFENSLRVACVPQGIIVRQALVRNIEPPEAIKQPINDAEIAREQIFQYKQQIEVAKSQAKLVTQEETAIQNKAIGEAKKEVVTIVNKAEQEKQVAQTKAEQDRDVAKLRFDAAQKQADALIELAKADANVLFLQKQAEAEPLARQIQAFGNGDAYARYFFYQKIAPSIKSILSNTDGPFADIFKQFAAPSPAAGPQQQPVAPATAAPAAPRATMPPLSAPPAKASAPARGAVKPADGVEGPARH